MSVIRTKIKLPTSLSREQKEEIALAAIEYIRIRTADGYDENGKKFKKYTKQYAEKKGVGRSDVDLIFEGDMLMALDVTKIGRDYVEIGYKDSSDQAGKAEGNIIGSYGGDPDPGKARPFLGVKEEEIELFKDAVLADDELSEEDIDALAMEAAIEILGGIEFDDE